MREGAAGGLAKNDLMHLLSDSTNLRRASVCGLFDLVWTFLGESNGEHTNKVVVGGFHGDVGFDERLPLANQGAEFVGSKVKTVEIGQAVLALDLVDSELDLTERVVLILLQIGQRNFKDATLQGVIGVLETGGSVDQCLADTKEELVQAFEIAIMAKLTRGSGKSREP